MKYRAEIDGLRAIAVIPVILFHAGFDTFKGGFIGVDIFFVISGYLISTMLSSDGKAILVHTLDTDDPDAVRDEIKTRYERRLKEIFQ